MDPPGEELGRLFQRAADEEDERDNRAADHERDAPAPLPHGLRRQGGTEPIANHACGHDGHLLACGLERGVEALVAWRCDLEQIDRHAAQFDTGGKALQQAADQDDDGRHDADLRVGRRGRDQHRACRHDAERDQQPLPPPNAIEVTAQHDGTHRPHERTQPECREGQHQRRDFVVGRKERPADGAGVEAEQEEVELFQEIATGRAQDGTKARPLERGFGHAPRPSCGAGDDTGQNCRRKGKFFTVF